MEPVELLFSCERHPGQPLTATPAGDGEFTLWCPGCDQMNGNYIQFYPAG